MLKMSFGVPSDTNLKVLLLGAHSDDIEIGCGGTVLELIEKKPDVEITWVVLSAKGERKIEAQRSAQAFLKDVQQKQIILKDFKDGYFPFHGAAIKDFYEQLKGELSPDIVFTHYRNDLHQDHRLICELTWNTFRKQMILEYEIPKYDGDLGSPNFYILLKESNCRQKVALLTDIFATQRGKNWFAGDLFYSMMRLRGMEARSPSKYAEAFYAHKVIVSLGEEE
jgi:LmbE family N-acetylglucosaminyl deacetylase